MSGPHIEQLRALGACDEAIEWARDYPDAERAWEACHRADWMLWLLVKEPPPKSLSVAIAIDLARTVLHLVPDGDDRPRLAIEAAEAWLRTPTEERRLAAAAAARAALAAVEASDAAWAAADIVRRHIPHPPALSEEVRL